MTEPKDILDFWFGELADDGTMPPDKLARVWKKDPAFDAELSERFGQDLIRARRGELDAWRTSPEGRVALIILLDQFSRNIYRGSGESFAADEQALSITLQALEAGDTHTLPAMYSYFMLMPLMHSEALAMQQRAVAEFRALKERHAGSAVEKSFAAGEDFAERHRAIVERFGRFPHRNQLLGRESSAQEEEFLKQPGSSF